MQSKTTVAVDSGELCTAIIQEIGERLREGGLQNVSIVPSCDAAASEAAFVGVPQVPSADVQVVRVSALIAHPSNGLKGISRSSHGSALQGRTCRRACI